LSLAQQIAQFDDTAPVGMSLAPLTLRCLIIVTEFDPEEIHTNDPHDNGGGVSALDLPAREHYLDVG
jgi:hypothetical protein